MQYGEGVCSFWERICEHSLCALAFLFPLLHAAKHPTILIGVLCGVILLAWLLSGWRRIFRSFDHVDRCMLLFSASLLAGGICGGGRVFDGVLLSAFAFCYFPIKAVIASPAVCRRARFWSGISLCLTSAFGIWQYFWGDLTVRWVDLHLFSDIGGRVTSFFNNPNVLAIYLLFALPLSLGGAADGKEKHVAHMLYGVSTVTAGICIVLTWTRGAWLGVLLQVLLFLRFFDRRTRKCLLWLPFAGLLAAPLLPRIVVKRFLSIGRLEDSSILYRLYTWRGVLRMIAANPFGVGVGEAAFRKGYAAYAVMGTETVMHAHSVFLQIASELGLLGGALFLTLSACALLRAARKSVCAVLPLCGLLVMGLFDHLWYAPSMLIPFVTAVAIGADKRKKDSERQENVSILHENF